MTRIDVVVLAPSREPRANKSRPKRSGPTLLGGTLVEEAAALKTSVVHIAFADDASVDAFGVNPLDPSTRRASATAGRAQGAREAREVVEFLGLSADA
ncbi:hypothetical protein BFL43_06005 [Williamsia sp. 1135]|nr:hypothetical protein BFL43_06005 [Williamsia sp. 1135]